MRSLFPLSIHEIKVRNFKIIKEDVTSYIHSERKRDKKGVVKSNKRGWQSQPILPGEPNILIDTVLKEVVDYFSIEKIFKENVGLKITNLWINVNPKGAYNKYHTHPDSHLSGVWWIKTPKNCGELWFSNHQAFDRYAELESYSEGFKESTSTYLDYYLEPQEGGMVVFPSFLTHHVAENESNQERISVSFNIDLRP